MVHDQEKSARGVGGGGGGGGGGGDGGGGGAGWWSRSAKKPKLQKAPPQRGLGVAQLEKILREKDQNMDENKVIKGIYSSLTGSPHNPHHPLPPTPPPPVALPPLTTPINNLSSMDFITRHLPVMDNYDHLIPPLSTLSGSGGGGGAGGGSARILSSHEDLSSMWNSHESNSDGECFKFSYGFDFPVHFPEKKSGIWPSPPMLPTKHCQYPPWVIDSGMNHKIEPPSNQRSYNYTSTWPEEEKTVGIKRHWTSAIDDDDQTDPPSSCGCGTTRGSELNKPTFSFRDLKKEVQPKLNPKKGDTDCGTLDASFLSLGLPATSSHPAETFSDEFSGFYSLPLQESIDESTQSSGHSGSSNGKPFYRILTANSQVGWIETSTSSIERRCETGGGGGVDLNLKLSLDIFNEPMVAFLKES